MFGKSDLEPGFTRAEQLADISKPEHPDPLKALLLSAGGHASSLGVGLLDSQSRFESVNNALASEHRFPVDQHIGKSSYEILGPLATQIVPTFEKVLRTGKPAFVRIGGNVRNSQEISYWFDYCFPIIDHAQRVQRLGLFVVNVTAEKTSTEMFNALAANSMVLRAQTSGLIEKFNESVRGYHSSLKTSLKALASQSTEVNRNADSFRLSLERVDNEIWFMRELIYAVIAKLPIPAC
jgi:hypothetical protein